MHSLLFFCTSVQIHVLSLKTCSVVPLRNNIFGFFLHLRMPNWQVYKHYDVGESEVGINFPPSHSRFPIPVTQKPFLVVLFLSHAEEEMKKRRKSEEEGMELQLEERESLRCRRTVRPLPVWLWGRGVRRGTTHSFLLSLAGLIIPSLSLFPSLPRRAHTIHGLSLSLRFLWDHYHRLSFFLSLSRHNCWKKKTKRARGRRSEGPEWKKKVFTCEGEGNKTTLLSCCFEK